MKLKGMWRAAVRDYQRNKTLADYWHHRITAQETAKKLGEIDRRYGHGRWA